MSRRVFICHKGTKAQRNTKKLFIQKVQRFSNKISSVKSGLFVAFCHKGTKTQRSTKFNFKKISIEN